MNQSIKLRHPNWNEDNEVVIDWFIGNESNIKVDYVNPYFQNGSEPYPDIKIITEFCDKLFSNQQKNNRPLKFKFSGGEFTTYKDFIPLMEYLKLNGAYTSISSNGFRSIDWWKQTQFLVNEYNLEYYFGEIKFDHLCSVVDTIKDFSKVSVNFNITPENFSKVDLLKKEFEKRDFQIGTRKRIHFYDVNRKPLNYSDEQKKMLKEDSDYFEITNSDNSIKRITRNEILLEHNYFRNWYCKAGVDQIVIDAKGNIWRGWCKQGGKIGNIRDEKINFPNSSIVCKTERCYNGFDLMATKTKYEPDDL